MSSSSSLASTLAPQTFTGVSKYSTDLQSILSRASQIAQIPLTQLQNKASDNLQKKTLLGNTQSAVSDLATSIAALGQAATGRSLSATSSDTDTVTATNTGSRSPATYTITNIQSIATPASAQSASFGDANSTKVAQGSLTLTVGGQTVPLALAAASNNLAGLRDAINSANLGVSATILTPSNSSDILSVTATSPGATAIAVTDTSTLLSANSSGDGSMVTANYADTDTTHVATGPATLTVGNQTATFTLDSAHNNLSGLMNAINTANLGVTASLQTTQDGKNYVSVAWTGSGAAPTIGLTSSASVLNQNVTGSDTVFTLNGNIPVDSKSTTINNVIPGVTLKILKPLASANITVTLKSDPSQLANTLSDFVNSYNAMTNDVNLHRGQNADLLSGDATIQVIQDDMRQLVGYQGTGAIRSLSDLGITVDKTTYKLDFDPTVVNNLSDSQLQSAFDYLGSTKTGLASFAKSFTQISDPLTGSIKVEEDGYDQTDASLTTQMNGLIDRINTMQSAMQLQLAAADTMLADLESQQNMLTTTIQAMNYSTYGYQSNPNG